MLNIYNQQRSEVVAPPKNNVAAQADFRKYNDPTGEFGSKDLSYSMWYVKHKVLLYRLGIFTLVVVNVCFFIISGVRWFLYISAIPQSAKLESDLAKAPNYTVITNQLMPKPLQVAETSVFSAGTNIFGAASKVTNPNDRFVVHFTYYFLVNGLATDKHTAVLLPKQTSIVPLLGQSGQAGSAKLVIELPEWKRLSSHDLASPEKYQNERLRFAVNSFQFQSAYGEGDLKVHRVLFNLVNESAFSFRQPNFYVGLYSGGSLVGVLPLQFDSFASQEVKAVDLRYFVNSVQVQSVEIFPQIDVYDEEAYLPPAS